MRSNYKKEAFFIAFLCYIWTFYKNGNIKSNSLRACTRNASWVNFKMATATKAGACLFFHYFIIFTRETKLDGLIRDY